MRYLLTTNYTSRGAVRDKTMLNLFCNVLFYIGAWKRLK